MFANSLFVSWLFYTEFVVMVYLQYICFPPLFDDLSFSWKVYRCNIIISVNVANQKYSNIFSKMVMAYVFIISHLSFPLFRALGIGTHVECSLVCGRHKNRHVSHKRSPRNDETPLSDLEVTRLSEKSGHRVDDIIVSATNFSSER